MTSTTLQETPRIVKVNAPGRCSACGGPLVAGEQVRWWASTHKVAHKDPARCQSRQPAQPAAPVVPTTPRPAALAPQKIEDGCYTVVFKAGPFAGQHCTLRLQTPKDGFGDGQQVIAWMSGCNNEVHYTKFGFVDGARLKVWQRFTNNPETGMAILATRVLLSGEQSLEEARLACVKVAGLCYKCGKLLSNPESIDAGIGPECRRKEKKGK